MIVEECKVVKGNSYGELSELMENLKIDIDSQVLKQKFHQMKTVQTANKIDSLLDKCHVPNILKTVYQEDKENM